MKLSETPTQELATGLGLDQNSVSGIGDAFQHEERSAVGSKSVAGTVHGDPGDIRYCCEDGRGMGNLSHQHLILPRAMKTNRANQYRLLFSVGAVPTLICPVSFDGSA